MWMSVETKKDSSSFEEFKENFWRAFQCWDLTFGSIERYDVVLDKSELRQVRDKYLHGEDYPSLNELKKIIIFKSKEDRWTWGTNSTADADDFNDDLQRGIKKALELARFDLGQVKPKIYEEEETGETAPVPKEPSPPKKTLRVYEAAEKADVDVKTISRWAREPDSFPVIWNKGETHIKGIPKETFLEYLKGKTKNQS
jgi:hypothetical protein